MRLIKNNRNDSTIIAFLVLESYFRPLRWRIVEYLYWISTGNLEVSLGIGQIKAKNNLLLNSDSMLSRLKCLRFLESFEYNYDSISLYLNNFILENKNDLEICKYYNGENVENFYVKYFIFTKDKIESLKNRKLL